MFVPARGRLTLDEPDKISSSVLELYSSLAFKPSTGHYTVLASIILSARSEGSVKVISLSTGSKCLPTARLPPRGDALHDSHAEVLARRGAVRWFLEEIGRLSSAGTSDWIQKCDPGENAKHALKDGVHIHMYISTIPCKVQNLLDIHLFLKPRLWCVNSKVVTHRLAF